MVRDVVRREGVLLQVLAAWPATNGQLCWINGRQCVHGHQRSSTTSPLSRRTEKYGLSGYQSSDAGDRAVDSCIVLVRADDRLHHLWRRTCRVGIKVQHRAAEVAHGDGDGGGVVPVSEGQHSPQPSVLLEGNRS